jgi:hypothetical protein
MCTRVFVCDATNDRGQFEAVNIVTSFRPRHDRHVDKLHRLAISQDTKRSTNTRIDGECDAHSHAASPCARACEAGNDGFKD